jgi:hypothetical protein
MQLDWRRLSTCLQLRYESRSPRLDELFNDENTIYYRRTSHCTVRLRHTAATSFSSSHSTSVRPSDLCSLFDLFDLDYAKQPTYIGTVQKPRPTAYARPKPAVIGRRSPVHRQQPVFAGLSSTPVSARHRTVPGRSSAYRPQPASDSRQSTGVPVTTGVCRPAYCTDMQPAAPRRPAGARPIARNRLVRAVAPVTTGDSTAPVKTGENCCKHHRRSVRIYRFSLQYALCFKSCTFYMHF